MTSYELINEITRLREAFQRRGYLVKAVNTASELFDRLVVSLELYAFNRRFLPLLSRQIEGKQIEVNPKRVLSDARELLKQIRSRQLFADVEDLERNIFAETILFNQRTDTGGSSLITKFFEFVSAYEQFIEDYDLDDTLMLLKTAKALRIALDARMEVLTQITEALDPTWDKVDAQHEQMTLLMHSLNPHLAIVSLKLNALQIIYSELCRLAKVSEATYPLIAAKVETGSLLTRLFGESQVTKLMTDLIRAGVQFLHRNYTTEGRLEAVRNKIEIVDTNILLEQRLRALGYDTASMREDIQKAGAVITKQTNILLEGEAVLSLNGEKYSVGAEVERQYIEKSKTLLLPDKSPTDNDADPIKS